MRMHVHCALCNAESQKRSAKGSYFKEDDRALPLYKLLLSNTQFQPFDNLRFGQIKMQHFFFALSREPFTYVKHCEKPYFVGTMKMRENWLQ